MVAEAEHYPLGKISHLAPGEKVRVICPTSYQAAPLRDMSLYNITYGSAIVRYLFLFYAEVFNR